MLNCILFDYSGTVLVSDPERSGGFEGGFMAVADRLGMTGTAATDFCEFALKTEWGLQEIRDQTILEITFRQILNTIISYLSVETDDSVADLEAVFYKAAFAYAPAPGIHAFLDSVRAGSLKSAIISNSTNAGELIQHEIEKNGLYSYFDKIMSSADYGVRKQHPLLFEVALKNLGVVSDEAIFIGDNLKFDIATAQNAGLRAAWYNRNSIANETDITPDLIFCDWADVSVSDLDVAVRHSDKQ